MENKNTDKVISSLDRVMRLLRRRPGKDINIGRGVFRLLRVIEKNDGITTRELASMLEIRPSSMNERLVKLEEEGFVIRERDVNDQRVFTVRITEEGTEHLETLRKERKDFYSTLGGILNPEESTELEKLLDKFSEGIEKLSEDGNLSPIEEKKSSGIAETL